MSESRLGFSVAATRQKGGSDAKIGGGPPRPPRPAAFGTAGGANAPAATGSADVIVVFGRASLVRLSHDAAPAADVWTVIAWNNAAAATAQPKADRCRFMAPPECGRDEYTPGYDHITKIASRHSGSAALQGCLARRCLGPALTALG
jgi:hypothetical protein